MNRHRLHDLALLLLAVTTVACGDDTADGAGGGNAYSEDPVLGTEHDGRCETARAFDTQCEVEGGIRTEVCTYSTCQAGGRCAEPPSDLEAGQFVCGDAEVCGADQLCIRSRPLMDGCPDDRCALVPGDCAETPTCDCVLENTSPGYSKSRTCTEVDGHFVIDESI